MNDLSNSRVPKTYPTYVKTLITTPVNKYYYDPLGNTNDKQSPGLYDGGSRRRKRHSRRRRVTNKKSRKNRKSRRHHRRR